MALQFRGVAEVLYGCVETKPYTHHQNVLPRTPNPQFSFWCVQSISFQIDKSQTRRVECLG